MRVILAFIRNAFNNTFIYRMDFWLRLVSSVVMMYATYSLWNILYLHNPNAFGMTREQMTTYGVLGMMLAPVLDAASFVQFFIGEQVRQGTIELDIVKPLNFIFHMFSRNLGMFCVQMFLQGFPAFFFALAFLDFRLPPTSWHTLMFICSLLLGYLIFFAISLIMGLLSIITLKIDSYIWAYFSLIRFASGQIIPLWMFPPTLGAIVLFLPFKDIYFTPMAIYIGATEGNPATLLVSQIVWVIVLFVIVQLFWLRVNRHITIQGG